MAASELGTVYVYLQVRRNPGQRACVVMRPTVKRKVVGRVKVATKCQEPRHRLPEPAHQEGPRQAEGVDPDVGMARRGPGGRLITAPCSTADFDPSSRNR